MLTKQIFDGIADALDAAGYSAEEFNPRCNDVMDIWHRDRSLGYIEITFCHAEPGYAVACPVDYGRPDSGLIEIINDDVSALVNQLDKFYTRCARRRKV